MQKSGALALVALTFLTACTETGGVDQRVGTGAVLGGVVGAVTGAIIGDRKGAAIGAGVGVLAGAAIGGILSEQQKELEKNLEGTGATVVNTGEEILVSLPDGITFDVDRADIKPEFRTSLSNVAATLVKYESSLVDVIGHTDATGSDEYNQRLSQRRADAVSDFLNRRGVIRERLAAFGRGETEPVADNATAEGRSLNRRVELRIEPLTQS